MSSSFKFLPGLGNGGVETFEMIDLPDFTSPTVKSDFYINAPIMKVDKLITDAENELFRKLASYGEEEEEKENGTVDEQDSGDRKNWDLKRFLEGVSIADKYKTLTRNELTNTKYKLKARLQKRGLTATVGVVSSKFRKSSIDNNLRYLLSNEAIYVYCISRAYFEEKIKDADGLFSRVQVHAKDVQKYINEKIAEKFFADNKLDKDEVPLDAFKKMAADSMIPFTSGQPPVYLKNMLGKIEKEGFLPLLVDNYAGKLEIPADRFTPDIKQKMIEHLHKMGVNVVLADVASDRYDEYLALAYSHAKKLTGGVNDPLKNLFSDVAVDTFDYKVDYFETIEEQSIDRSHILGAAVLFYTKVLSDDMGLLRIADAIIMAWTQGKLDIPHGETATKLYRYYKLRKERMTAEERSMFYKIVFNTGSAEVLENSVVNTDFPKLWNSLMQETVKYIQKWEAAENADEFVSKVGIYNSIKNLQYNISVFMTGMIKSLLPEMYAQLQSAIEIVKQPEVVSQLGQGYHRNMWKVVERIGAEVFNSVPNVSALKTIAIKGHSIFSAIAGFDEAQFTDEAFRKFITDVEEFIVANGQLDGSVLESEDEEDTDSDDEEESVGGKKDDWDF